VHSKGDDGHAAALWLLERMNTHHTLPVPPLQVTWRALVCRDNARTTGALGANNTCYENAALLYCGCPFL